MGISPQERTASAGRAAAARTVGTQSCRVQWKSSTNTTIRSSCSQEPNVMVAWPFWDMNLSWFTRRSFTRACLKPSSSEMQT